VCGALSLTLRLTEAEDLKKVGYKSYFDLKRDKLTRNCNTRNFNLYLLTNTAQVIKRWVGYIAHTRVEMQGFWRTTCKEIDHLEDICTDWRI
jgi:hypothetical protein